jgi:hypothetical protein
VVKRQKMELAFGYKNVPETAKAVLGVRAIYNAGL